jgi:hypothetical protein
MSQPAEPLVLQIIAGESGPGAFPERLTGEGAAQHYAAIIESSADAILSKDLSGVFSRRTLRSPDQDRRS